MSNLRYTIAISGLTAAIFLIDISVDLGLATPVAYVLVIALAYSTRRARAILLTAGACSLLTVVGWRLSPPGAEPWKSLWNRAFAFAALWAPVVPSIRALSALEERELLANIVDFSGDSIVGNDLDGTVRSWNRGAERLYGYRAEEMVGSPFARVVAAGRIAEFTELLTRARSGLETDEIETIRLHRDGTHVHVSLRMSIIRDAAGRPTGASFISRDITRRVDLEEARRRINAELAQSNEALERSNAELQQFAYVASHDLQTPLRAIVGFAQFLEADYGERLDDTAREYIARIIRGGRRLQELIQDLLEFARVESRSVPFGPVELNDVFAEVSDALQASICDSSAELIRGALPTVWGDRVQLAQLLQNLIENALKYRSKERPLVLISAEQREGDWVISVRDNGIGIPEQYREKVFEIFSRLHATQAYPGTGIGLAICRRIVNRQGGKIWLEANEEGGVTASFTVPVMAAPAAPVSSEVLVGDCQ